MILLLFYEQGLRACSKKKWKRKRNGFELHVGVFVVVDVLIVSDCLKLRYFAVSSESFSI